MLGLDEVLGREGGGGWGCWRWRGKTYIAKTETDEEGISISTDGGSWIPGRSVVISSREGRLGWGSGVRFAQKIELLGSPRV